MNILKSRRSLIFSILHIVKVWAEDRSKDPTSKVGAAVYDKQTGAIYLGYNGFPPGFPDRAEWWNNRKSSEIEDVRGQFIPSKYDLVIHAEKNAIRKAHQGGANFDECILVCTHIPCPHCVRDEIIPSGITQVYYETSEYKSNDEVADALRKTLAHRTEIKFIQICATEQS